MVGRIIIAPYLGQCTCGNFEASPRTAPIRKDSGTRTFNAKISGGGRAQDSRGQLRLCQSLCTSFIRNSNSKVGGLVLGIKYPPAEVCVRSDPPGILPTSDLRRHLSEPLRRPNLRNVSEFCRWVNPHQCRPDSPRRTDSIKVSTVIDHLLDFVRAPTGVGLPP